MRLHLIILGCISVCNLIGQTTQDTFLVKPYLQFATQNSMYILWELCRLLLLTYLLNFNGVPSALLKLINSIELTSSMLRRDDWQYNV